MTCTSWFGMKWDYELTVETNVWYWLWVQSGQANAAGGVTSAGDDPVAGRHPSRLNSGGATGGARGLQSTPGVRGADIAPAAYDYTTRAQHAEGPTDMHGNSRLAGAAEQAPAANGTSPYSVLCTVVHWALWHACLINDNMLFCVYLVTCSFIINLTYVH